MTEIFQGPAGGAFDGVRHVLPLRVYYEDTDFSGVVYHASYLRFFERGRTEFVRALGIDQKALHAQTGTSFAVRRLTIDYLKPALMDDVVVVETRIGAASGASLQLEQALRRDGEVLASADVLVVCIRGRRPQRLPEAMRGARGRQA